MNPDEHTVTRPGAPTPAKAQATGRAKTRTLALAVLGAIAIGAGALWADPPAPTTAPAPTTRVANCTAGECHAKERNFKVLHGPASLGACDVCHGYTDEKKHKFALKREGGALCSFCHVGKTEGKFVHKAVADGQCLGCHNPHGGPERSLLRAADMGKLCATCHGDVTKGRSHAHGPVAAGNCVACHNAHSSNFPKLLVAQGRNLCLGCHEQMNTQLKQVKFVHQPAEGECLQCHEAHASNQIMQLKEAPLTLCGSCHEPILKLAKTAEFKHSPVTVDPACLNCHTPHGGDIAKLMKNQPAKVCLTCHDKPIKVGTRTVASEAAIADPAQFKHGPIRDGNCAGCHMPHGGPNSRLLTKPYPTQFYLPFAVDAYALCFSCHDKQMVLVPRTEGLTNFRNGDTNLHYLHVNKPSQGRSCRACHETHASKRPLHIRESVPYGQWEMPLNFVQTRSGGRCSPGCHQPLSYDRLFPVTQPSGSATSQPAGVAASRPADAATSQPVGTARSAAAATRPAEARK